MQNLLRETGFLQHVNFELWPFCIAAIHPSSIHHRELSVSVAWTNIYLANLIIGDLRLFCPLRAVAGRHCGCGSAMVTNDNPFSSILSAT